MLQSVMLDEDCTIIDRLLRLHDAGPRVLDVTYGHGRFWDHAPGTDRTVLGMDIRHPADIGRQHPGRQIWEPPEHGEPASVTLRASLEHLPFQTATFDAAIFDPPFLIDARGAKMGERYTSPANYTTLLALLNAAAIELRRTIRAYGLVIIKAMDTTDGRRRRWLQIDIHNIWEANGWRQEDQVVKVGMTNLRNPDWHKQTRTKSAHCYFMVFKRRRI